MENNSGIDWRILPASGGLLGLVPILAKTFKVFSLF